MIIEVKSGKNVKANDVRALRGVRDGEAEMASTILLEKISKQTHRNWESNMAKAGFHEVLGMQYPRCQILTVEEILKGKRFQTPSVAGRGLVDPVLPGISSDISH